MNEVHRTLIIFLSASCLIAPVTITGACADNPPTKKTTILQGGAEDAEKMQKSIKLMVPDPTAPTAMPRVMNPAPPGPIQTEINRSDLLRMEAQSQALLQQDAAERAAALQRQQEAAAHQAMMERHFGFETITNTAPTRSYLAPSRSGITDPFMRGAYINYRRDAGTQAQVDPWTDVVAVPFRQKNLAELQASIKKLRLTPPVTTPTAVATGKIQPATTQTAVAIGQLQPIPNIPEKPLRAVEMMLPMAPAPKDWDAWYKRVANAIYDRWRQNTAGPGTAVVLIAVYASRDVDCRVTDFTEADGAVPNATEESRFKQISLQCVDGLSGDEIWQFPNVNPRPAKIVFDMEFKHVVGQDSGCRIVHLHNQMPPSSQR